MVVKRRGEVQAAYGTGWGVTTKTEVWGIWWRCSKEIESLIAAPVRSLNIITGGRHRGTKAWNGFNRKGEGGGDWEKNNNDY